MVQIQVSIPCAQGLGIDVGVGVGELLPRIWSFLSLFSKEDREPDKRGGDSSCQVQCEMAITDSYLLLETSVIVSLKHLPTQQGVYFTRDLCSKERGQRKEWAGHTSIKNVKQIKPEDFLQ